MKNEKIKEFLTKLAQEESFKVEFLKLKEKVEKKGFSKTDNEKFISECLLPWSKKLGYKLSKKDFIDFDRTQKPTEITGLSPAELENVSGGGLMLLSLFAMFGSALAGLAGGGGSTGNNANTNSDSLSASLVQDISTNTANVAYGLKYDDNEVNPGGSEVKFNTPSSPFDLNQNMFSTSSTPSIPMPETGSEEHAHGLLSRIGETIGGGINKLSKIIQKRAEDYLNYGKTPAMEYDSRYEKMSADFGSGAAEGGDGGQSVLIQSPQTPNSTPVGAPMFNQTHTTQGNSTLNVTQNNTDSNTTQGRSSSTSNDGPKLKDDLMKFAAGMSIGLTTVAGITGTLAEGTSGDTAQQNSSKTKGTTAKAEDKKTTKEAKEEESEFMRIFRENLQKNSPEAFQYLESLKNE